MLVEDMITTGKGRLSEDVRFDIRSQRKVDNAQLLLITDAVTLQGSAMAVRVNGIIRVLCLT